jgi:hypothetical protein
MPFTDYATRADVDHYIPNITHELWGSDGADVDLALTKAARKINEFLKGLNRIPDSEIPLGLEDDGAYPEVLIELNVYEAVWQVVTGTMAGEAFEDHWSWVASKVRDLKMSIRDGVYTFGPADTDIGTNSTLVSLARNSV